MEEQNSSISVDPPVFSMHQGSTEE